MDIWTKSGATLDIRVARGNVTWLKQLGLQCTTLRDSVEELVRNFEAGFEKKLLSVKRDSVSWFEEYVSYYSSFVKIFIQLTIFTASNSTHMMIS